MSTLQTRLVLALTLALVLSVGANLLFLQNRPGEALASRIDAERPAAGQPRSTAQNAAANPIAGSDSAAKGGIDRSAFATRDAPAGVDIETIRAIQRELALKGYEPGAQDGRMNLVTQASIMAYEADYGLPLTAEPGDALLRHIVLASASRPSPAALPQLKTRTAAADQLVRTVQQSLARIGYFTARVDGTLGEPTERAIREFEMDSHMSPSGRISGMLVMRLARAIADGRRPARKR